MRRGRVGTEGAPPPYDVTPVFTARGSVCSRNAVFERRLQRRVLSTPELALAPVSYLARRWSCRRHRRLRLSDARASRGSGVVLI